MVEVQDKESQHDVRDKGGPQEEQKAGGVAKIFGFLWQTDYSADVQDDQELRIRRTFKELIIYTIFLILVVILAFSSVSIDMFYYTKVMATLFAETSGEDQIRFINIQTTEDFWQYLNGPFLDALYWDKWYNNLDLPSEFKGYIYYENKLLGVPRLRQLRVKNGSCNVNTEFRTFISTCYAEYSTENEDKKPFGQQKSNTTEWSYRTAEETKEFPYWGILHIYGAGGYVKDLFPARKDTEAAIADLESKVWIQRGARAVIISFAIYNANINLFCIVVLTVEFPPTGGAIPGWNFVTLRLIRYVDGFDNFIFVVEIIFCIFIIYYIIEEIIELSVTGCQYFSEVWNILDILLLTQSILCIAFSIYRSTYIDSILKDVLDAPNSHASRFQYVAFSEVVYNNMMAITVFTAWIKVFKYISFNKTMTQLSTTLSRCAKDLLGFFIMFFIVFLAFTQLGYLLFGNQVKDFSTFMDSFFTLFRIILGDFNFYQLQRANRVLGPIYFMIFVFFVFFVLINMFLAIINDTYSEVKSDMTKQADQFIMSDFIKQGYHKMKDKYLGSKTEKIEDYEGFLAKGGEMNLEEWKKQLKKMGFKDQEINEVFKKYDVAEDKILDVDEQKAMVQELQQNKSNIQEREGEEATRFDEEAAIEDEDSLPTGAVDKDQPRTVAVEDFTTLSKRVDRMEATIRGVVKNIDTVLTTISNMR